MIPVSASSTPEPPMPTDSDTTDFETTSTSMSDIPTTEQHENHETTMITIASGEGVSVGLLAAVIGGVAGSLLVFILSLVLLLLLVPRLVWRMKKYKLRIAANNARYNHNRDQEPQLEGSKRLGEEQRRGDEDMMMEVNDAYISNTTQQILTEDNVAYGQATSHGRMHTVDNVAYGQLGSVVDEYDYI